MATTIDSAGFIRDRLDTILANLDAAMRGIYGDDIDLSPSSPDGQFDGILAEAIDTVGQLAEDVFAARAPAGARGAALSRLVQLVGISRNGASYSTADVVFSGTPGTFIPAGSLVDTTATPAAHFQTTADVTIDGTGSAAGTVRATATGPVFGAAGAISVIKTVISGWTSVTNAASVNLGSNQELDSALRARFRASVAINAKSVVDGIYAALANVQGVSDVAVFENKTGAPISRPGASDLPPNSINCVVRGGLDSEIGAAIWAKASAGVTLTGAATVAITDSQGNAQAIKYDRPVNTAIYAEIRLAYPPGGPVPTVSERLAVATALVTYGNSVARTGKKISYGSLWAPVAAATAGATSVFGILIGSSPGILNTLDLSIPFNAFPTWDVGYVTVTLFAVA